MRGHQRGCAPHGGQPHERSNARGFILDFDGDLYGQTVRMEFYRYLRGEQKFPTLVSGGRSIMRNAEGPGRTSGAGDVKRPRALAAHAAIKTSGQR